jgi:hypothetical protein
VKRKELILGFVQLGKLFTVLGNDEPWDAAKTGVTEAEFNQLKTLVNKQFFFNGWFVKENIEKALRSLGSQLTYEKLEEWAGNYSFSETPKKIAIIMAGNIPLVGFHDFLSVIISGNSAVCKLSSDDKTLLPALVDCFIYFLPEVKERITFTIGRIGEVDAVIATGSDNSLTYFNQYFGKYPHIFRKNRTSIAVIRGDETKEDFNALGHDIFDYFGLGCRNVSHLFLPKGFELKRFFEGIIGHSNVINHNKYGNNYDYNKAIFLMNQHVLFDNNFVLLRESNLLFSPLSMVHYQFYETQEEIDLFLNTFHDKIQVVVGKNYVPFGNAQSPKLNDYADGIDTLAFLNELNNLTL